MESDQPKTNHARRRSTSAAQFGAAQQAIRSNRSPQIPEVESNTEGRREIHAASGGPLSGDSSSDWEMDHIHSDDNLEDDEETGLASADKDRRRRRKRRRTLPDGRVMGSSNTRSDEEDLASRTFVQSTIINTSLIGLWYAFSISISVFNKWVLDRNNVNFHFPLFFTSCHMIIQFALSGSVLYFIPRFRPRPMNITSANEAQYTRIGNESEASPTNSSQSSIMSKFFYFTRIAPCGAATGLDIGLGNMSLMYISLTFFTMCKSSVLGFVLLFAFLFRLESPSWKLAAIIATMAIGVIMMVAGEAAFNALGFILIMAASFFSGFRWSLTQILLRKNPATSNPFSSIFFLAPVMFITLIIIAFFVETWPRFAEGFHDLAEAKGLPSAVGILLFPGGLAFCMTAAEFALLKRTSVVTLSVCGIFKEVLTISTGALVFGDPLTPINISGLLVTIASIAAYNYMKMRKMRAEAKRDAMEQMAGDDPILDTTADRRKSVAGDGSDDLYRQNSTSGLISDSLSVQVDGMDRVR